MRTWLLIPLSLAVLFAGASCSSERDTLELARASLAAGDLEHAERVLAPLSSSRAAELLEQVRRQREHRETVVRQIDELFARSGELSPNELRDQLRRWREREREPGARELYEVAMSEMTERYAKSAARRPDTSAGASAAKRAAPTGGGDAELVARLRSEVREAIGDKQWQRAEALLVMLADQPRDRVGALSDLRGAVRDGALFEAERLIAQAHQIERDVSAHEACAWLRKHAERFPPTREFERLTALVSDLDERAQRRGAADAEPFSVFELADDGSDEWVAESALAAGGVVPAPPDIDAEALVELARESAARGELAFARQCALAASGKLFAGDLRDDCVGLAQDLRARLTLREELKSAWATQRAKLEPWGVSRIDEQAWEVNGEARPWRDVGFDLMRRVATTVDLSALAQRGMIAEALAADAGQRRDAGEELARMVERGAIEAEAAAGMISRSAGGIGAAQRFRLAQGKWASEESIARSEAEATDAELERRFLRAAALDRERAFEALVAGASLDTVRSALASRTSAAVARLAKSKTLDQLRTLASLRTELDLARKEALALIFDEKTYFYPYNPPEPPNTPADYVRAQKRVDDAVDKLRDAWRKSKPVKLPKDFLAALDELEWARAVHERTRASFALPESLPSWILALPLDRDSLDLQQFAWSREEAAELARSRAVEARNERWWAQLDKHRGELPAAAFPDVAEREQVRITNRYRVMFGRRAVAWNPQIQSAAQGHSEYMANTGDFGHFENDPERRTPSDRARLEGYNSGVSENCAMVGGDPQSAHDGWRRSSGHHRNLLMASHREMASAVASNYWTQNFGADRAFERDLDQ